MNVIVSNKQKEIIDNANIDAIKDLNGLFSVDDLVNKFKNYFFSKMILDATSVVNFATREVLQKLADEIGPDRLIILLPSAPEPPEEFKKLLVELKIYNFSNNIDDVVGFIDKPNTYENIMNEIMNSAHDGNEFYVDNSIKDGEEESPDLEQEATHDNAADDNAHSSLDDIMSRFNVHYDTEESNDSDAVADKEEYVSDDEDSNETEEKSLINGDMYQINNDKLEVNDLYNIATSPIENNTEGRNIFLNVDDYNDEPSYDDKKTKTIIGVKNITLHAGSTTLVYMLEKLAEKKNKDVMSIEINRDDFRLFRNNKMISVKEEELSNTLNSLRESLIFVDLNDCIDDSFCTDIIYLVEPSVIKLNRLMMTDRNIFDSLKDKKVVLNQSMLLNDDIPILEKEANMKFFDNIGSVNDRSDNLAVERLYEKLMVD